jgi:hypothetical protein
MIRQIILFLLGILISSISLMFIIIYLNLLKMNFTIFDYIKYIFTHIECLMILIGILFIKLSFKKRYK